MKQERKKTVGKRFDELFDLIIINPSATYYNSVVDQCKGTVNSENINTLCNHLITHTSRATLKTDFLLHAPAIGNRITKILWSGHRITSTKANGEPEENRNCSFGTGVFILERSNETNRERDSIGTLMHELCHQYDGIDHYHEDDENGNCIRPDICSFCNGATGRPKECIMYNDNQDIFVDTILCEECRVEIRIHLEEHH